ncbi:MAG: MMPL family transporter [Pirellulales bacterium]
MFARLGRVVTRHPWLVILSWLVLALFLRFTAPRWDDVTFDGDLAYLPATAPSVRGQKLLEAAFPGNRDRSQIAIIAARDDRPFDSRDLKVVDALGERLAALQGDAAWPLSDVWTRKSEVVGSKLRSADKQAQLIILQLTNEFAATDNIRVLGNVEQELAAFRREWATELPEGLQFELSGSAAVGGDMLRAAAESIQSTETLTIALVLAMLLIVYRAPLLITVPLIAIVVSLSIATNLLALLTQLGQAPGFEWWNFKVFKTTRIFIVVILYGSGTDFCLFLISRYREELAAGKQRLMALADSLAGVGDALLGSALTTVIGLAAMFFSDFGKFRNSGPAIGLCLLVTLAACLTLAPALLAALGSALFWPLRPPVAKPNQRDTLTDSWGDRCWQKIARVIVAHPFSVLSLTLMLLAGPAAYGVWRGDRVTYDLLSELSPDRVSRRGSERMRSHFAVGEGGPIILLAHRPGSSFGGPDKRAAAAAMAELSDLASQLRQLPGVDAVRSLAEPLGDPPRRLSVLSSAGRQKLFLQNHRLSKRIFVSQGKGFENDVARLELVLKNDPFSPAAIHTLAALEQHVEQLRGVADSYWSSATFLATGTTASIRDLRDVTRSDHQRIQLLVTLAVFAILLAILRRPLVCAYLILTVLFSYLVTMGCSQWFFERWWGDDFGGVDWKVPTFLFVILVAVGQDYNIYLATRVFEEQSRLGKRRGLEAAIARTGGIITSCGLIMAGSFVTMVSSSLRAMVELGFALSLGIILDTFIIRTVLVPAFFAIGGDKDAVDSKVNEAPSSP